jgi:hypothetical protein
MRRGARRTRGARVRARCGGGHRLRRCRVLVGRRLVGAVRRVWTVVGLVRRLITRGNVGGRGGGSRGGGVGGVKVNGGGDLPKEELQVGVRAGLVEVVRRVSSCLCK